MNKRVNKFLTLSIEIYYGLTVLIVIILFYTYLMLIREVYPEERENYNDSVNHILQSYEWGVFRETTGVKIVRLGIFEGVLKRGFQLTLHPFPHTTYTIGYFPRGGELTPQLLEQLEKIGKEQGCIFIKIEPNLPIANSTCLRRQELRINEKYKLLSSNSILPQHTFIVDLYGSEEEILSRMKEKTRYNIKLSQKHEVVVEEKNDSESLEIFIKLTIATAKRQGFFSHPADYYQKLWEILYPNKMVHLLIAKYQTTPLAAIMLFKFKDILYYPYGGSAIVMREKMPNHLLHWEAIKLGKRLGCTAYDMWGAYKNTPTDKDPWFGIYRFKEGFGSKLVTYPETLDLVFNPRFYKIYKTLDPLRFKLLSLKRLVVK